MDLSGERVSFYELSQSADGALLYESSRPTGLSRFDTTILQQVCDRIASSLGDFHIERHLEIPKHGTGRVSNHDRMTSKYHFDQWPSKLDRIFPYDFYARTDFGVHEDMERDKAGYSDKEHPSKLIAVPKTLSGPRLIASEPNQYQWIQQLIRHQLEARIKSTCLKNCISFGDQTNNQVLALSSSYNQRFATVDLKSASDRLSAWTIERAFRSNISLLERLHASRSRTLSNCVTRTSFETIRLKKAFTQGSGCNFPMQTVSYAMMAIAAVILTGSRKVNHKSMEDASHKVRIFGDDIIVPVESLVKLKEILVALQLRVNDSKTFSKGKFRESCGCDAYNGVEITPVYIRDVSLNPDHEQAMSVLETSNNLFKRGLWNLADWQASLLSKFKFPVVKLRNLDIINNSHAHAPSIGYASFCGESWSHLKSRWDSNLQTAQYFYHALTSSTKKKDAYGSYSLYQYFIDRPSPLTKWQAGTVTGSTSVLRGKYRLPVVS